MKKYMMMLAMVLATSVSMAMERVTNGQELIDRAMNEKKLVATVFSDRNDPQTAKYEEMIKEYEASNSDVVFLLADINDQDVSAVAMNIGVTGAVLPLTVFSSEGLVLARAGGIPETSSQITELVGAIQEIKAMLEQQLKQQAPQEELDTNTTKQKSTPL